MCKKRGGLLVVDAGGDNRESIYLSAHLFVYLTGAMQITLVR